MSKKIIISMLGLAGLLLLSGCGKNTIQNTTPDGNETESDKAAIKTSATAEDSKQASFLSACQAEKVSLPNYGDQGKRLKNCFVEYPGEPSRQDKSYYIVEDICGQFSQPFMENMLGMKLAKIEAPQVATLNNCSYYFDEKRYMMLNLEYLSVENQKNGNLAMDRKVEANNQITIENAVVYQEDDVINVIYLILNPNKFISMRPSAKDAITNEKFIALAANIAAAIKGYK